MKKNKAEPSPCKKCKVRAYCLNPNECKKMRRYWERTGLRERSERDS